MSKNPFVVLGLNENATRDEAYVAYRELRSKYENLRFESGDVGADACAMLEEIETAYSDVLDKIDERERTGGSREDSRTQFVNEKLDEAEQAIKEKRMEDAQKALDECSTRTARWHYIQSAIFYRKGWVSDAMKQLELACDMEPGNQKYREAKESLAKHMKANTTTQGESFYENGTKAERTYADARPEYTDRRGCTVCDVCSGLICADCCCECMGGDLISCC